MASSVRVTLLLCVVSGPAATVGYAVGYDTQRARRSVDFSGIAYCSGTLGHGVDQWNCHACKAYPNVSAVSFVSLKTAQNGFVAYDPNDGINGSIVVSFAGTDPLQIREWIDDLDTAAVSYPGCKGCRVHRGFYENFLSVHTRSIELLSTLASSHEHAPIFITGHSLGAAVAVHFAAALANQSSLMARLQALYTFGLPRVGNPAFASYMDVLLNDRPHFRVTHRRDPVPHLPPQDFGFIHTSVEVFYKSSSSGPWRMCDGSGEDKSCSDQYDVDLRITDHLEYVGFDFISNYLHCKL